MRFKCTCCDEWQEGMPSFGANAPLFYYSIPVAARHDRCVLDSDTCVIDGQYFFVLGCLEIPVHGEAEPFSWGRLGFAQQEQFRSVLGLFRCAETIARRPLLRLALGRIASLSEHEKSENTSPFA